MMSGQPARVSLLLLALAIGLAAGCSDDTITDPPPVYNPIIESLELTPNVDAGAPLALPLDGDRMAVLYTAAFESSGDIHRLVLHRTGGALFDSAAVVDYYPNPNDSTLYYPIPEQVRFTEIGAYEIHDIGSQGQDTIITNYPGNVYFSGPRQLFYDEHTDRIYYSMGYGQVSQIASTQSPVDAGGGHSGEIVNTFDAPLQATAINGARPPIWDYWYTKVPRGMSYAFTGGYYAAVAPPLGGHQYLAFADTLLESYDRDGFDDGGDSQAGEDPEGAIEVLSGLPDDGLPGIGGADDDGDGAADLLDPEVGAMLVATEPAPDTWSLAWSIQRYVPAWDDDEDGLMDEDWSDAIDNDDDGLIDEDPIEQQIDNDGDGIFGEDPIDGSDNDGDGLTDEDPEEVQIDNDDDGLLNEDGPDPAIDQDGDGLYDEDPVGDANGDGAPGVLGEDDGYPDELIDEADPQVRHSILRAESIDFGDELDNYDPALDDDEDGLHDEDGDLYRNGIWVVELGVDGLPDDTVTPISLTNDGGRQPFFNPDGSDLLYVRNGDIYRIGLDLTADPVTITYTENLTSTPGILEGYPAYSDDGAYIAYSSSEAGSADIWIMNAAGAARAQITNDPGQELFPRFTPDGDQILYEAWLYPDGARRAMITVGDLISLLP